MAASPCGRRRSRSTTSRILLGQIFDIPLSKIDVRRMPVGGTFGSCIQMNSPVPICAALALKARRPVKLSLTREEDMHDHTKYPSQIALKIAARKDGTLLGAEMNLVADIGAHIVQAYSFLGVCVGWMVSLYRLPNVRYHGTAVYTNKSPSCAMQGFGNPQVTFAVESLMDELAKKLDMDPIELRLKNYVGMGDTFWGQGPLVRSVVQSDGVPQLLRDGAEKFGWYEPQPQTAGRYRRGRGMARGFHTSSAGAPQPGDVIDYSGAMVKINQDGSVDVITALMDHGGGTLEALAKLASEALCVPLDKVNISPAGTRTTVYDVVTHATRGVYAGGGAVLKATQKVREDLLADGGAVSQRPAGSAGDPEGRSPGPGRCLRSGHPGSENDHRRNRDALLDGKLEDDRQRGELPPGQLPPAYVSVFLDVEVDTWTGSVRTVRAVVGSDCGTVINPDLAAGQLEGGLNKGAGFALLENNEWDAQGQLLSKGYMVDSKVPGISESPCLDGMTTHFADTYEPSGPFGAKGIGEAATNPVAAAYANAIRNAIGVRFYELPITPEKILAALKGGTCHPERVEGSQSRGNEDSLLHSERTEAREDQMNEMTNSHILINRFDYLEPASLQEAVTLLAQYGKRAKVLAGGTDLLVHMKMERVVPSAVISIGKIPGLDRIALQDGHLHIGALATIRAIENDPCVLAHYPALTDACASFSTTQVQIMGTVGGNLGNGSPAADSGSCIDRFMRRGGNHRSRWKAGACRWKNSLSARARRHCETASCSAMSFFRCRRPERGARSSRSPVWPPTLPRQAER